MPTAAAVLLIVLLLTLPPFADGAGEPCTALEARIADALSAPGTLPSFGADGRYGRAAVAGRLPYVPSVIGCAAAWWHVAIVPSAAPGWFAAMRQG